METLTTTTLVPIFNNSNRFSASPLSQHYSILFPKTVSIDRQCGSITPFRRKSFLCKIEYSNHQLLSGSRRSTPKGLLEVQAASSGVQVIVASSVEEFTFTSSGPDKDATLKISAEVSSKKTQEIYDDVFSKMVADAQPIPGFRRIKGGKTPNIPRDILLEILGPSKVYREVIKKIINCTITHYISKEGLTVGKDLQVEQSFEDLEAGFEPGDVFRFDAILQCREYGVVPDSRQSN